MISVIIPTLDEEHTIVDTLQSLQSLRGGEIEIVLVDGGSNDRTVALATPLVDRIELGRRGRAAQMNIGAALSRGDVLLFLHADTRLPSGFAEQVRQALKSGMHVWGRFDTRICSRSLILRVVGRMMNIRARCSGIATGDQAMFVLRADFERAGGFPEIPLMEDIALLKKSEAALLAGYHNTACIHICTTVGAERHITNYTSDVVPALGVLYRGRSSLLGKKIWISRGSEIA